MGGPVAGLEVNVLEHALWGKVALVVVALAGMALCTVGIGKVAEAGAWLAPWSIVAYVLGAAALALVVAVLVGVALPVAVSPWAAALVLVGIVGLKVVTTRLHAL